MRHDVFVNLKEARGHPPAAGPFERDLTSWSPPAGPKAVNGGLPIHPPALLRLRAPPPEFRTS